MSTKKTTTKKPKTVSLEDQARELITNVFGDGPIFKGELIKADYPAAVKMRAIALIVESKPHLAGYLSGYARSILANYEKELAESDAIPEYHAEEKIDEQAFKEKFMLKLSRIRHAGTMQVCMRGYLVAPGFSSKVGGDLNV